MANQKSNPTKIYFNRFQNLPETLEDIEIRRLLLVRREALLGGAVEPRGDAHRRVERVVNFLAAFDPGPPAKPPVTQRIFAEHDTLFSANRHGGLERSFGGNFWRNDETSDGEGRRLLIGGEGGLGRVGGSSGRRHSAESGVRRLQPGLDHFERACQDGTGRSAETGKLIETMRFFLISGLNKIRYSSFFICLIIILTS